MVHIMSNGKFPVNKDGDPMLIDIYTYKQACGCTWHEVSCDAHSPPDAVAPGFVLWRKDWGSNWDYNLDNRGPMLPEGYRRGGYHVSIGASVTCYGPINIEYDFTFYTPNPGGDRVLSVVEYTKVNGIEDRQYTYKSGREVTSGSGTWVTTNVSGGYTMVPYFSSKIKLPANHSDHSVFSGTLFCVEPPYLDYEDKLDELPGWAHRQYGDMYITGTVTLTRV